ncbi:CaiB/BaiF CoA transferase family protein [Sphingomonas cavernae]|uniref:CoA transferase n=1 Tax=Sphingomonas cavernae TaxID=2320861 RepID=A0A418WMR8_9SPHN|nr:CaiB/BaiF CoA-transferase family protein [Sphingomonas cavernae]RJF91296.1 CoA transferase [Sphingomonas cavernae]
MTNDALSGAGTGPLAGLRVVEFVSIGPGPHCAMLLSDLGADVVRIDREGGNGWENPVVDRGRATVAVDLRSDAGRDYCLDIADSADVIIEGFRPGVMERLGLGPDVLLTRNPRLVFGRITGWGQTGPLAKSAGHDINYIALTGALAAMGRPGEPAQPPLNLVGDFGGGSMLLAFGIMAALWERERSGKGQVIDAAIVDGTSSLMSMFAGLLPRGAISMERDTNLLGGAAPFYRNYICADGKEISIGPIEPHFYGQMLDLIGAPSRLLDEQRDASRWPDHCATLESIFRGRTASEWATLLEGTDACFAPVVPLSEAASHPHMAARGVYVMHDGMEQVAPVPRFSRTPGAIGPARDGAAVAAEWKADKRD